jgi:hypothetical protein
VLQQPGLLLGELDRTLSRVALLEPRSGRAQPDVVSSDALSSAIVRWIRVSWFAALGDRPIELARGPGMPEMMADRK